MDFQTAITTCFRKYAEFEGRALRSEFWWFFLFLVLLNLVLSMFSQTLATIAGLATLVPNLAVGARRLHDVGRSGWWQLISITVIGLIPLIYWLAMEGEPETNAFGAPPAPVRLPA